MGYEVGVACGRCDAFSPLEARYCSGCGERISLVPPPLEEPPVPAALAEPGQPAVVKTFEPARAQPLITAGAEAAGAAYEDWTADAERSSLGARMGEAAPSGQGQERAASPDSAQLSKEEWMDQARHYVCRECSTPVPSGHKFCGRCGAVVPPQILEMRTDFFGAMQSPGKARLILIRGDAGADGLSYLLQGTEHVAGREDGQIVFPEDPWLSPRHANFVYRGEKLVVRDEGSKNGVYVRIRGQTTIVPGDHFLCGEQVFRLERTPADTSGPDPDMTYFYSSPKRPSPFRLVQVLRGGADGMVVCAHDAQCSIGREECDLNFPEDVYMSSHHAHVVSSTDGSFALIDSNSKNGTYVRIRGERELSHGDYLFLGKQLLRVEITV